MRTLALMALQAALAAAVWVLDPPLGLERHLPVPRENPLTPEKVRLGWRLFFDARLSVDGTLSCANCHDPASAAGARNAPAIVNCECGPAFFWGGRALTPLVR